MEQWLIKKIVITWWPCGGKTTWMAATVQKIAQMWWNVLVIPETATILINNWYIPWKTISFVDFQDLVIKKQLEQEKYYHEKAMKSMKDSSTWQQNQLILLDRWLMDWQAYVDPSDFQYMLRKNNLDRDEIYKWWYYDGVVSMTSAAVWAEKYYTLENNTARSESIEEAREKDALVKQARVWVDKLYIINNSTNFEDKIKRTTHAIISLIWLPVPLEIEDKFAVKSIDLKMLEKIQPSLSHITQFYITSAPWTWLHRARKMVQWLFTWYIHTIKWPQKFYEKESLIDKAKFDLLQNYQIWWTERIYKQRQHFLAEDQYFSLDTFEYPRVVLQPWDIWLLEIEKTSEDQKVIIPSFMEVEEVTHDPRYSNSYIAWLKKAS